ncbi:MAG: flagellar hook-length control protein FliK [Kiloniellaceae bacterium]
MEALTIEPAKAGHQSPGARAQGGVGDLFQILLGESRLRLEGQVSFPSPTPLRETSGDPAPPSHSDTDRHARDSAAEPVGPDKASEQAAAETGDSPDDTEVATVEPDTRRAPESDAEPPRSETPAKSGAGHDAQHTDGQSLDAAGIRAGIGQTPGTGEFPAQAVAHTAAQAKNATAATPAARVPVGPEGAALRVSVTPAPLVAPPNAVLGGGATVAAMAAGASQAPARQAGQPGGPAQTPASETGNGTKGVAPAGASEFGQGLRPVQPGAGHSGPAVDAPSHTAQAQTDEPHNARTPHAPAQNIQARNALALDGDTQEARVRNAQARNAPVPQAQDAPLPDARAPGTETPTIRAQNSQGQNAPASDGPPSKAPAPNGQTQNAQTLNAGGQTAQGQTAQSPTAQPHTAQGGEILQAASPLATATAAETGASAAPGAATGGQQSGAQPGATALAGLTQAAARIPAAVPSHARPVLPGPVPIDQVAVQIQRAVGEGQNRIRIQLYPAELGRIEVKLELGSDGVVKAIVAVDKPETLEMFQRDIRGFEKALQDAGLKTDSGSLSFNLRGQGQHGPESGHDSPELEDRLSEPEPEAEAAAETPRAPHRVMRPGAIDIRV